MGRCGGWGEGMALSEPLFTCLCVACVVRHMIVVWEMGCVIRCD